MAAQSICDRFSLLGEQGATLKSLYGIHPSRPSSCRTGALDLLTDVRFTLPTETLVQHWRSNSNSNGKERKVFRYLLDEPNPWQPSARAHHTVDLALLFNNYDLSFSPSARRVAAEMGRRWILFVAGREPWDAGLYFAFGPLGWSMEIDGEGFAARRRGRHVDAIKKVGTERVDEVWMALARGNISLYN